MNFAPVIVLIVLCLAFVWLLSQLAQRVAKQLGVKIPNYTAGEPGPGNRFTTASHGPNYAKHSFETAEDRAKKDAAVEHYINQYRKNHSQ